MLDGCPDRHRPSGHPSSRVAPVTTLSTVVAAATATRALPGPNGTVPAESLQQASLAVISDMFAVVVPDESSVPG